LDYLHIIPFIGLLREPFRGRVYAIALISFAAGSTFAFLLPAFSP